MLQEFEEEGGEEEEEGGEEEEVEGEEGQEKKKREPMIGVSREC